MEEEDVSAREENFNVILWSFFDQIYIFSIISTLEVIHFWRYRFVLNKIDYFKARSLKRHSSIWRLRPFSRFHFNQKRRLDVSILHLTFMKNHKHGLNELVKLRP